ncbi:MAG: STAS domain-containing protein [Fervidobacterium sp.]|uniref:Anti-sigma factor antagonist n=1 Tax=Fervidobacterium gondwanense DSM 13020 TaxID=1121883 RepID=A0A1M7T3Y0_FERGO|nr:STAS domain-containing protein [Fervidobacterium gondwanense]UXF01739.1 anti-sigma factor antagonist [Fervidobacterium riparium]SHN65453.1 anti-anti-sigma regulatory factor, SpoIIAA [Fervidobacterium gondwanense DSM 13020]
MEMKKLGDIVLFKVPEEMELTNAQDIKRFVYENSFDKGLKKVILDFSETKYIDSTGLGTMVALHKQALMNAGAVVFLNLDSNIKNLLKMTALDRILNIYDNEREAIEFLNK